MKNVRELAIGQVIGSTGKGKWNVNFYALGKTLPMTSCNLTLLDSEDARRILTIKSSRNCSASSNASVRPNEQDKHASAVTPSRINCSPPDRSPPAPSLPAPSPAACSHTAHSRSQVSAPVAVATVDSTKSSPLHGPVCQDTLDGTSPADVAVVSSVREVNSSASTDSVRVTTDNARVVVVGNEEIEVVQDEINYALKIANTDKRLKNLVGEQVTMQVRGTQQGSYKWTVLNDHLPDRMPSYRSSMDIGFNFEEVEYGETDPFIFAKMFLSLLFKDFKRSLNKMNDFVVKDPLQVRKFGINEFLKGLGIWVGASCFGQKGHMLFQKKEMVS